MEKEIKIYHVETQEDYDDLMVKLEEQGYRWRNGNKPTRYTPITKPPAFIFCRDNQLKKITIGNKRDVEECYLKEVIRYKAKGVEQMGKVVVPQFVADWYEERKDKYTIHGLIVELNKSNKKDNEKIYIWRRSCQGRHINKLSNAQEVIAKMHLYGYEVEEEKKYYWRKKKEYLLDFETEDEVFLKYYYKKNKMSLGDRPVYLCLAPSYEPYKTKFTETEVRELVSEEDFNKLERVEIDDV